MFRGSMATLDAEVIRKVLEGMHGGVYVADRAGKILFWNDGAERITGYLRQDMMGRLSCSIFVGQPDIKGILLAGVLSPLAMVIREVKPVYTQVSLRHKSGHRVP